MLISHGYICKSKFSEVITVGEAELKCCFLRFFFSIYPLVVVILWISCNSWWCCEMLAASWMRHCLIYLIFFRCKHITYFTEPKWLFYVSSECSGSFHDVLLRRLLLDNDHSRLVKFHPIFLVSYPKDFSFITIHFPFVRIHPFSHVHNV